MTKSFKAIAIIISIITMVLSTYAGVWAAKALDNVPLGTTVQNYVSLDSPVENVGMVNVLLIGVDEGGYRSDTIMLISMDDYSDRVSILSIPRDTRVKINGTTQKINATMAFAAAADSERPTGDDYVDPDPQALSDWEWLTYPSELSQAKGYEDSLIEKIKSVTGLPIHYFVTVDFSGFMDLIAVVDGVDFDVPYDMDYDDPVQGLHIHLEAGPQHLDAQHAHDFVRFRHNNNGTAPGEYVMGDEGRIYWQQQFIKEVVRQKLTPQYLSKVDDILEVFRNNVRTNLTMTDVVKNLNALTSISLDDIRSYQLPGESELIGDTWYYIQDENATRELVNEVFLPQSREKWEAYLAENEPETEPVEADSATGETAE